MVPRRARWGKPPLIQVIPSPLYCYEQILVYDQGFWQKDHALWEEIQKFKWDDVILKQEFKDQIQGDIESFFKSEAVYKELAVPWKVRSTGLISSFIWLFP